MPSRNDWSLSSTKWVLRWGKISRGQITVLWPNQKWRHSHEVYRGPAPVLIVSGPRRKRHGDARYLRPSGAMRGMSERILAFGKYTLAGFIARTPSAPL